MLSDCPPSKPTSIRTWSATCHYLREDAVDGIRMDERDFEAEQPGVRLGVDELGALAPERLERRVDVRDLEGDVVHPWAARGEGPPDGRLALERRQELDTALADEHGGRLDALVGNGRPLFQLGAEETRVRGERLVEVVDGHTEVVNPACVHRRDRIGRSAPHFARGEPGMRAPRACPRSGSGRLALRHW